MTTRPKGSSFAFADQGVFISATDIGCRTTASAAVNTVKIVAALTAMTTGGVLLIPHGIDHTFTSADFPVTPEKLCVWEFTGNSFKLVSNTALTADLGELLETIRIVTPKVIGVDFVDVLTEPPAYTFQQKVYNNSGSPVIDGSSFDLCYFIPGVATPTEAVARSGATPGLHYFFNGISTTDLTVTDDLTVGGDLAVTGNTALTGTLTLAGTVTGSRSIQAPATGTSIVCAAGVKSLILNHSATIATLTVTLPAAPVDGTPFKLFSRSIVTTLTLAAGTGKSIETGHTLAALAAAQSAEWVYNLSDTKWYRVS